jgi:hypothetical protein
MGLILSAAGLAGVLGLAGCGAGASPAASGSAPADVADEAVALRQVGYDTGLAATPAATPTTPAAAGVTKQKRQARRKAIRRYLRGNTLHGEVTVQGKDGTKTIVVQRGSVTAVTSTSVTVKSTDGFTETWTVDAQSTLVQDRKKVPASVLRNGEQIGVAGVKSGTSDVARLIAVK